MDPEHCYQDLSIQQKREEERLKKLDPSKAAQIERLGMGFGGEILCLFDPYVCLDFFGPMTRAI
jgi:hypothetical protein